MTAQARQLDLTFAALADPTRRAILQRLMLGEASVNELVAPFDLSQPTISKHLQVLARAGLIERRRDAQFRPCRLRASHLAEAWDWLGGYRRFWEDSLDRLETFAKSLQQAQTATPSRRRPKQEKSSHGRKTAKRR
jgi:DNA-binding transcriptional ArsR family regulator